MGGGGRCIDGGNFICNSDVDLHDLSSPFKISSVGELALLSLDVMEAIRYNAYFLRII